MTAGVAVPVDDDLMISALASAPRLLRKSQAEAIEDRRFAEAVYRAAIADGVMENVTFQDPTGVAEGR
jgi:hypothetical protein